MAHLKRAVRGIIYMLKVKSITNACSEMPNHDIKATMNQKITFTSLFSFFFFFHILTNVKSVEFTLNTKLIIDEKNLPKNDIYQKQTAFGYIAR